MLIEEACTGSENTKILRASVHVQIKAAKKRSGSIHTKISTG